MRTGEVIGRLWIRFRRLSRTLRFRVAAAATLAVGVVFALGSLALIDLQERLLDADLDLALGDDIDAVSVALLDGLSPTEAVDLADEATTIRVEIGGEVVAEQAGQVNDRWDRGPGDRHGGRVVSRQLPVDGDTVTIVATRSRRSVEKTTDRAVKTALAAVPMLTLLVGFVIWRVVGRTLRPVDAIRAEAAAIVDTDEGQRLSVPATGDEIERLATTLNTMLDRLAASGQRQRRLVADAAHELRTPLAGVQARLEVDEQHGSIEEWPETRSEVLDQVRRLQRLIDSLLLLSRRDAGQLRRADDLVDLDDIVAEAIASITPPQTVTISTAGVEPVQVRGDTDLLTRVAVNLLDNAVRHATSRVSVVVAERDDSAVLEVSDNGPGIAEADRELVFDRFVRLDESRARDQGGAGLGLAITRELVELHAGTVTATTAERGATFIVSLPKAT